VLLKANSTFVQMKTILTGFLPCSSDTALSRGIRRSGF